MSSVSDVLSFEVFKGQVDGESSRQLGVGVWFLVERPGQKTDVLRVTC